MTGFYSKDFILESAYGQFYFSSTVVYFIATIGAMFTTLYSVKVLYLTFLTSPNGPLISYRNAHEGDIYMSIPLIILAIFSIFFGYITKDIFIGLGSSFFSDNSLFIHPSHEIMLDTEFAVPTLFKLLPLIFTVSLSVISIILCEYLPKLLIHFKLSRLGYNLFGFFNQRFLIELFYNRYITDLVLRLGGQTTKVVDKGSVELLGPYGLEKGLVGLSKNLSSLDTGVITSYALYILVGLIFYILTPYLSIYDYNLFIIIIFAFLSMLKKLDYTFFFSALRFFSIFSVKINRRNAGQGFNIESHQNLSITLIFAGIGSMTYIGGDFNLDNFLNLFSGLNPLLYLNDLNYTPNFIPNTPHQPVKLVSFEDIKPFLSNMLQTRLISDSIGIRNYYYHNIFDLLNGQLYLLLPIIGKLLPAFKISPISSYNGDANADADTNRDTRPAQTSHPVTTHRANSQGSSSTTRGESSGGSGDNNGNGRGNNNDGRLGPYPFDVLVTHIFLLWYHINRARWLLINMLQGPSLDLLRTNYSYRNWWLAQFMISLSFIYGHRSRIILDYLLYNWSERLPDGTLEFSILPFILDSGNQRYLNLQNYLDRHPNDIDWSIIETLLTPLWSRVNIVWDFINCIQDMFS